MKFVSTRDISGKEYKSYEVIRQGIAPDGGLFFPVENITFSPEEQEKIKAIDYPHRAATVIGRYLTDFTLEELEEACKKAYSSVKFPIGAAPVTSHGGNYFLELYHGPTCAFKDLALQLMPYLLTMSVEKSGSSGDALILVATSGDTGKAALEGFCDVERTKIMVFFPQNGVSEIQKKQMLTQKGKNVTVCGVNGNFDDCQTNVKLTLTDKETVEYIKSKNAFFSSANSINFGRLVPQVAYYASAVSDIGSVTDVCVPTGNFGNILAAYMAKKAGFPIGKLICASNKNNVLTDFFNTGVYDKRREFYLTSSPSMDILVSSNLERLLFLVCGAEKTAAYMKDLKEKGSFKVDDNDMAVIRKDFSAYCADESECESEIRRYYRDFGYLIDTHTSVASCAVEKYKKETGVTRPVLIVSTASPFKFAPAVCKALGFETSGGFASADALASYTGLEIPSPIGSIRNEKERFDKVIEANEISASVKEFI